MNLKFLETLVCVAEARSFRQAAARLHTTQPAVSARIRALEEQFGAQLLDRSGREVRLTPAGFEALRYAQAITDLAARMQESLSSGEALHGILRIGVIDTIIHSWLPQLIERVRAAHPKVSFELTADTSLRLGELLRAGDLDLSLAMGPLDEEAVVSRDIGSFPMAWVASPRHFHFSSAIDVSELAEYPVLSYPRHSKPYRMIERYFSASQGRQPLLNCSNSLASLVRLAVDGIGIAAIPPVVIEAEIAHGDLSVIPVRQTFPSLAFQAFYLDRPGASLPAAVAGFAGDEAARFAHAKGPGKALPPGAPAVASPAD